MDDIKSLTAESDRTSVMDRVDFQDRCWRMLYHNIDHAVDELYYLCEEEEDICRCFDAINLLHHLSRDFTKLVEKIQAQKHFNDMCPSSISWEVRRLCLASRSLSPQLSHANVRKFPMFHESSIDKSFGEGIVTTPDRRNISKAVEQTVAAINRLDEQFKSFTPKILRPEAQPFYPRPVVSASPTVVPITNESKIYSAHDEHPSQPVLSQSQSESVFSESCPAKDPTNSSSAITNAAGSKSLQSSPKLSPKVLIRSQLQGLCQNSTNDMMI